MIWLKSYDQFWECVNQNYSSDTLGAISTLNKCRISGNEMKEGKGLLLFGKDPAQGPSLLRISSVGRTLWQDMTHRRILSGVQSRGVFIETAELKLKSWNHYSWVRWWTIRVGPDSRSQGPGEMPAQVDLRTLRLCYPPAQNHEGGPSRWERGKWCGKAQILGHAHSQMGKLN